MFPHACYTLYRVATDEEEENGFREIRRLIEPAQIRTARRSNTARRFRSNYEGRMVEMAQTSWRFDLWFERHTRPFPEQQAKGREICPREMLNKTEQVVICRRLISANTSAPIGREPA
jgi:hypothetical protein